MISSNLHEKLLATQDRDADIDLLRGALSIDSVTGNETGFATFLKSQMETLGLETGSGEFLPGRLNVWGQHQPVTGDDAPASSSSATPTPCMCAAGRKPGRASRRKALRRRLDRR